MDVCKLISDLRPACHQLLKPNVYGNDVPRAFHRCIACLICEKDQSSAFEMMISGQTPARHFVDAQRMVTPSEDTEDPSDQHGQSAHSLRCHALMSPEMSQRS